MSFATREAIWGYAFVSPFILGFLLLSAIPIFTVVSLGFTDYNILEPPVWVGMDNYTRAFTNDPLFLLSIGNTAYYVLIGVPLQMILAFFMALLLNAKIRALVVYRALFYTPVVVPAVAASVLWTWMFDSQLGPMRFALAPFGLQSPDWLFAEEWSKPAMIVIYLWHMGSAMIIFLAGLQGIPEHLYEAAEIDGASNWRRLLHVTIPMMTPTILFNVIVSVINSFQVFTYAYVMTGGGPLNSTLFYVLLIYRNAFQYLKMGYASAMAVVLFLIVLVLTVLIFRMSRSHVYYEGGEKPGK